LATNPACAPSAARRSRPRRPAVGELREHLDLPPATLSAHLNVLRSAGLVLDQREGRVIRVRANYERMNALIAYLTENCCAGPARAIRCLPVQTAQERSFEVNRFHVHLNVADLDGSIAFYTSCSQPPLRSARTTTRSGCLEDPRVNFAISNTGRAPGIDPLGLQVASAAEALRPRAFDWMPLAVPWCRKTRPCAATRKSDKLWTEDPQGTRWETFQHLRRCDRRTTPAKRPARPMARPARPTLRP
jgi:hypothetical protein